MNNMIMLLIGAFLVDLCIEESGAGTRLGLHAINTAGNRPLSLLAGFMVVSWGLSMVCANVSVSMMVMPFVLAIIERIDDANKDSNPEGAKRFAKASLLGVAYACSVGGMATTIGTAPNLIMTGQMGEFFGDKRKFIRSFVPSFLRSFVPFHRSIVPSFARSFLRSIVPSFLCSIFCSLARSFLRSSSSSLVSFCLI